jgi:hypothetical protein
MARVRFISNAVCAVLALPCLASPANGAAVDFVQPSQRSFQEYLDLLSIPNIAVEPRDMQRNAEFLEQSFRKRGFDTQRLENSAGTPLVFAQLAKSHRGAPPSCSISTSTGSR